MDVASSSFDILNLIYQSTMSSHCRKTLQSTHGICYTVHSAFDAMPEAANILWNDAFFENEGDVIAVFDFDYEAMESFQTLVSIVASIVVGCTIMLTFLAPMGLAWCIVAPFFIRQHVRWQVHALHVAVTVEGVRLVHDKRRSILGLPICDIGRQSRLVPFEKIKTVDLLEPRSSGAFLYCIPHVLDTVIIDTIATGSRAYDEGAIVQELEITGLKKAHAFQKLVLAMKKRVRGTRLCIDNLPYDPPEIAPGPMVQQQRNRIDGDYHEEGVGGILKEIRDELRHNNELLRAQSGASPDNTSERSFRDKKTRAQHQQAQSFTRLEASLTGGPPRRSCGTPPPGSRSGFLNRIVSILPMPRQQPNYPLQNPSPTHS